MDFQTFFVYFLLIIVLLLYAKQSTRLSKFRHVPITDYSFVIPILFFSLIIGLRYMVGTDYPTYLNLVQNSTTVPYFHSLEPFFQHLILFIERYNLHFSWFFIISAFLQIFFFYKSFDRPLLFLLPWAVPLFLMQEMGALVNVVRHFTALMIFFYSLKHIKDHKLIYYIITILIASLFHTSVLICLPLYFIVQRELIKSVFLRFGLVLIFLIAAEVLRSILLRFSEQLFILFGYGKYLNSEMRDDNAGIGYILILILNFIIIGFYTKLKEYYLKSGFMIYWNLFYFGLLLKPIFDFFGHTARVNWYFYKFRFLLSAFLLHYLYQHRNNPIYLVFFIIFLFLNIFIFIHGIMKGSNDMSPFYFIWDKL